MACIYTKQFSQSKKLDEVTAHRYKIDNILSYIEEQLTELITQAKKEGATEEDIVKVISYYADKNNLKQFSSKNADLQDLAEELVALYHKADEDGITLTKEESARIKELEETIKRINGKPAMEVIDGFGLNDFGY